MSWCFYKSHLCFKTGFISWIGFSFQKASTTSSPSIISDPISIKFFFLLIFFSTWSPQSLSTSFQSEPLSLITFFFLFPHPTYLITIISNLHSITISSSSSSTNINVLYNFDSSIPFSHSSYFPSFVVSPLCHFDMSISPQCPIIHQFLTSFNNHLMVTRSKHGILKPKLYNLSTLITSNFILIEPTTY